MPWLDSEQIKSALEATFNQILATRMRGLPVVNPLLSVHAIGFERFGDLWPGVLVTPWFMNLLILPDKNNPWLELSAGNQFEQSFPAGNFIFTVAQETRLGIYAQCSLFSPMFQFIDQGSAIAAAQSAWQGLLTRPAPRAVSRRDLLRGQLGNV
ncbi:MAG: [NiFe]-hydrogenase assembly chaperone HybE [Methylomonas sp.]|jgi:[NiFe] hydrogenase assembly HybE family chaperone|uniref:[NiFe]-hydrogenase assembly chaperone HybE n=1 Tax=Methylomonas sp. TaxID=418 RepID=UPI0025FB00E6|nr:[NiFe]-hydrogenase assembly chaperone HybE [Methylomonas sp.]MCK9607440.1 [NiFe]-hydrogenase assembly chaperone HybE [Methylomonas sp.]